MNGNKFCPLKIKTLNGCHSIWMRGTCIKGGIYGIENAESFLKTFKEVWLDGYNTGYELLADPEYPED